MTTRGRHGAITELEIARVVEECAADDSPIGRRDALIVYCVAELGIALEVLIELDVCAVHGDHLRIDERAGVELPEMGQRLTHAWLDTRGPQSGPLLLPLRSTSGRRLTLSALRAVLARRCIDAGVAPFTAADISRTRQARYCGAWSRSCCTVPLGPLPAVREVEPLAIRALGRMGTERRSRTTKLLGLFAAQLQPPEPPMSVHWDAISDAEIEAAISRMAGTVPLRQINAVRRAVLFVRRDFVCR